LGLTLLARLSKKYSNY